MSPYVSVYSNHADQAIAWLFSSLCIGIGALMLRRRFPNVARSELWLSSMLCAFRDLALLICIIFVVGLVFLVWLQVSSIFWTFWEVMYALSVISLFWVFPAVVVGFSFWVCLGRFKKHYSKRSIILYWQCLLAVAVDVLLYFLMASVIGQ
jgi:hypothetical protein